MKGLTDVLLVVLWEHPLSICCGGNSTLQALQQHGATATI
jgi:hypothetical protein